jgi:hypothetical protein
MQDNFTIPDYQLFYDQESVISFFIPISPIENGRFS